MRKFLSLAICSLVIFGTTAAVLPGASAVTAAPHTKVASTAKNTTTKKAKAIAVTKVNLTSKKITLNVGTSYSIKASVTPANATNKTISWSTSDKKVAKVSNGKVTAVNAGTCKITATSSNGKSAILIVTVNKPIIQVKSVTLSSTFTAVTVSGTVKLTAKVNPSNAANKSIIWTSSNKNIATVDANGLITGKAVGTCTITAKASNGKSATCNVAVQTPDN